jgi:hypothetical protein
MVKVNILLLTAIFSACSPSATALPQSMVYLDFVEGYLVENIGIASFGGQVFCSYEVLDTEQKDINVDVYVWALCEEHYLVDNSLEPGTASSLPVALHLQRSDNEYYLQSYEVPKDGIGYGPSIEIIFPELAIKRMCEGDVECPNQRVERLELENKQKAREYYGIVE